MEETSESRERVDRVVYALLRPAAELALRGGMDLRAFGEWAQLALFHVGRGGGLTLQSIVDRLGVSMSHAARLSRRLKRNFLPQDQAHVLELASRIEFMLWPGPLSAARIAQGLRGVELAEVEAVLGRLEGEGAVELVAGRTPTWRLRRPVARRVLPDLFARIDALNSLGAVLADAVWGRFFGDDPRAFARSLMLRVRAEDLPALRALYEETVWPALERLDEAAASDPEAIQMAVALLWAPYELIREETKEGGA